MTDQELNEIEARDDFTIHCRGDVAALIAEVRQLKAERDVLINSIIKHGDECPCSLGEDCQKPDTRDYCDGGFYGDLDRECYEERYDCWLEWARKNAGKEKKE